MFALYSIWVNETRVILWASLIIRDEERKESNKTLES